MHPGVSVFLTSMRTQGYIRNIPNISDATVQYLRTFFREHKPTTVLEIGSANGYSTIIFAQVLHEGGGDIVSIDMSRHAYEEARQNFATYANILDGADVTDLLPANFGPKVTSDIHICHHANITYLFGNALEILPQITEGVSPISCVHPASNFVYDGPRYFDLIFIDGQFVDTLKFFFLAQPLLSTHGTIIIDDVIKYAWKMKDFFAYLNEENVPYIVEKLDEDDGIMIL